MKQEFRDFKEARSFVQKLNLKRQTDWEEFCKSGKKPQDIPRNPYRTYKKDWKGMGDWLGTGRIATQDMNYRPFKEARKFVHSLKLKNREEWRIFCKSSGKPKNIPANPELVYKNQGWSGIGDWLGTGTIASFNMVYRPFKEARKFAKKQNLKSYKDWSRFCKSGNKPDNIPNAPDHQYKNKGWISWGDFLGTGRIANYNKKYLPFIEAREFVRKLNLKGAKDWAIFCKSGNKPEDIPTAPTSTYKKEWKNWGDWYGTGTIAPQNREYRSFNDARKFVQKLKLKNSKDWENYCQSGNKPDDIPSAPWLVYKEWKKKIK